MIIASWLISGGTFLTQVIGQFKSTVTINGVALPQGVGNAILFPGWYEVGVADDPLLEAKPMAAFVGGGYAGPIQLSIDLKQSVRGEIEAQVRKYVAQCAAYTELTPVACPFSASAPGAVQRIKWTITSYPQMAYKVDDGSIGLLSRLWFASAQPGHAEVTGVNADGTPFRGHPSSKCSLRCGQRAAGSSSSLANLRLERAAGGVLSVPRRRPRTDVNSTNVA